MTKIKRIIVLLLLFFSFSYKINAQSNIHFRTIKREVKTVMGVQYQQHYVVMTLNGKVTNQQITYIGANPLTDNNISLVALDSYPKMGFARGTLTKQIDDRKGYYPDGTIVSAVNGDFFDINRKYSGVIPSTNGPHIRDGNVICEGYQYYKPMSVGIKEDGTPFLGKPEFDGLHVEVFDEEGSLKQKELKVKVNELPTSDTDLRAFVTSFNNPSSITGRKMIIKVEELNIHKDTYSNDTNKYYIRGKLERITEDEIDVIPEDMMVLVGDDFFLEGLITENDTVRLQNRPSGNFKGIQHAISGIQVLVEKGVIKTHTNVEVHPRTAAGIKEDGTIFFIVVDGRQDRYAGVTREELGHIMKYFGAYDAFNLDGGGSSTLVLLDEKTDTYVIKNSPSGGGQRANGNGIGFIYGPREVLPLPVPYPDNRTVLSQVNSLLIEGNKLMFNSVPNADRYVVMINGKEYETEMSELNLDLVPGLYDISIKAYGNHELYKQSKSDPFSIEIYSSSMQQLMDDLLNYGKNTYQYINE